jgi:oligoribonuclease
MSTSENETSLSENLIWIDLEMTGLDTRNDSIIEIATVVTDKNLNELAEGPVLAIGHTETAMNAMDEWNTRHHGGSGLIDRVLASNVTAADAERQTIEFLTDWVAAGASPMCGNSICQDRRFLAREMPELETYFHYRNLDVSTLKILAQQWAPAVANGFNKESSHRALSDIRDSIAELVWYRDSLLDQGAIAADGLSNGE